MGKAYVSFPLRVDPFAALFYSRHCTCHHLTQLAGLGSLHCGTSSMSFYGNAAVVPVLWWMVGSSFKESLNLWG